MHAKSDSIEITIGIEELFDSHLQRYQEKLEQSMRENELI